MSCSMHLNIVPLGHARHAEDVVVEAGPFVPEEKPGAKKVKEESAPFTIHNQICESDDTRWTQNSG